MILPVRAAAGRDRSQINSEETNQGQISVEMRRPAIRHGQTLGRDTLGKIDAIGFFTVSVFGRARYEGKREKSGSEVTEEGGCYVAKVFWPIFPSVPFQRRTMLSLCLIHTKVLTTIAKIKNSWRCSFTMATTGNNPKAASAPPDE